MISLGPKDKRFNLLYLDEQEIYVKDFKGNVMLYIPETAVHIKEPATIHLGSFGVFIETDNDKYPIFRYPFKCFKTQPKYFMVPELQKKLITFEVDTIIEIPTGKIPQPYKRNKIGSSISIVRIELTYSNMEIFFEALKGFYFVNISAKTAFDLSHEVEKHLHSSSIYTNVEFDKTRIKTLSEKPLIQKELRAQRILPLISIEGLFFITDTRIYFQPIHSIYAKPLFMIKIINLTQLFRRRYRLLHIGIEIATKKGESFYFSFSSTEDRNKIYGILAGLVTDKCQTENSINSLMNLWASGGISNFDYLMHLNTAAYRSFLDLSQYPVFPWILTDYKSNKLDLNNPEIYRDLSKPIGALNPKRLKDFKDRFESMPENEKFLYGVHYSTPGYVIHFLLRKFPIYMLKLQSGNFDNPNRLFVSIGKEWNSVLNSNGNIRELIPEFFVNDPSFLLNNLSLNLGSRSNGKKVYNVGVPKWANKSAETFLTIHREALESNYVSEHLNDWIDLIFGFKQKGSNAIDANNLFHPMTYEGYIDLSTVTDPAERKSLEIQIQEFGQTPRQLFKDPHPKKLVKIPSSVLGSGIVKKIIKEVKKNEEDKKADAGENKINAQKSFNLGIAKKMTESVLHKDKITSLCFYENESKFITSSKDGVIKIISIDQGKFNVLKAGLLANPGISCFAISADNLYAGTFHNSLIVFNLQKMITKQSFLAHDDTISSVFIIKENSQLITTSHDSSIRIWKVVNNAIHEEPLHIIYDHTSQIISADILKLILISLDSDGNIMIKNVKDITNTITSNKINNCSFISTIKWLSSETYVITNSTEIDVFFIDSTSKRNIKLEKIIFGILVDQTYCLLLQKDQISYLDNSNLEITNELELPGEHYYGILNKVRTSLIIGDENGGISLLTNQQ